MSIEPGVRLMPHDRRALAIGAVIIGSLVGATRGVPALLGWRADALRSTREIERDLAAAERSIQETRQARDTLEARAARLRALDSSFVAGQTPAEIGSRAALLISEAASASESRLGSVEILMDSVAGTSIRTVSVHAQVVGDVATLAQFLSLLESGPALLRITELSLAVSDAVSLADRGRTLRADVTVKGIAHPLVAGPGPR